MFTQAMYEYTLKISPKDNDIFFRFLSSIKMLKFYLKKKSHKIKDKISNKSHLSCDSDSNGI